MTKHAPVPALPVRPSPAGLLRTVREAAQELHRARTALETAIREARQANTLREVADAAGISHESVRRITGSSR
jgi:DNA-directed RNA polymerase sigma subunit (sigma70/sigma32)